MYLILDSSPFHPNVSLCLDGLHCRYMITVSVKSIQIDKEQVVLYL